MNDDYREQMKRVAADQEALAKLTPEEREAEMQRRAELFRKKNNPTRGEKVKQSAKEWTTVAVLGAAAFLVIAGIGWIFWGGTTEAEDLEPGDCFMLADADDESFDRLETPDCTEPHEAQVYHTFSVSDIDNIDDSECLSSINKLDLSRLGDESTVNLGSYVSSQRGRSFGSVLCWASFPTPVSISVYAADE